MQCCATLPPLFVYHTFNVESVNVCELMTQ